MFETNPEFEERAILVAVMRDKETATRIDEYLDEPNALVIIEWASRADSYLPPPSLFVDMTQADRNDNDKEARQVELRLSKAGQAQGLDLSSLEV